MPSLSIRQFLHPSRIIPLLLLLLATIDPDISYAAAQRVAYRMEIVVNTENHSYKGKQRLTYVNNSPDTLRELVYHLYYEAFRPGSMMDRRDRSLPEGGTLGIWRLRPDEQGEVRIESIVSNGKELTWKVNETIMRVEIPPLLPGDSTVVDMEWTTRIPRLSRRGGWMSNEGVEYSMSQWYPKVAAYDASGWHADEYVAREFYGVYGTFDVSITIPAEYVLGGTGTIVNPTEVGCGYELGAVDTLLSKPVREGATGTKTWKFHAENVHDFAWVADPDYAHQIVRWRSIPIHLLFKRDVYGLWRGLGEMTRATIEYFNSRFGPYAWPQFTVAMAGDGGMEYPMLIMITGYRGHSSLAGVMAHELGHQWYYGMIGNNETQEAWMDEGFTQYLTDEARRKVLKLNTPNRLSGLDAIVNHRDDSPWRDIQSYYQLALTGYSEPLVLFHDWMRETATSGLVYYKGEAVIRMLQNMMGDSLFYAGMRRYLEKWRFRNPGYRDYEKAMEEASGLRLDWFFNQWIGTDKKCDYAIDGLSSRESAGGWETTLDLSNRDEIVMPLDITLEYDDGSTATANVPVEAWRKPGVEFNLPRWYWMERNYSATFTTPRRVVHAVIDTSMHLLDLDRTNNSRGTGLLASILPESRYAFYKRWDRNRLHEEYSVRLRPTLWYSLADGIQPGFTADGGYTYQRYNAKAGLYYNIRSKRVDYDLGYDSWIEGLGKRARIATFATSADGVQRWGLSLTKEFPSFFAAEGSSGSLTVRSEREVLVGPNYPNEVAPWEPGGFNTIGLEYRTATSLWGSGSASLAVDFDASFASGKEFTQWTLKGEARRSFLGVDLAGDLFAGTSVGDPPAQRIFNAAGARSREMHLNLIHRLAMNAHPGFAARNHLLLPTQGYLVSLVDADSGRYGEHLLNARIAINDLNPFSRLIRVPFLEKVDLGIYGAAGLAFADVVTFDGFEHATIEAGAVASIDLLDLLLPRSIIDAIDPPSPVRLSFHLPLYADSPYLDGERFRYRWGIGVSL